MRPFLVAPTRRGRRLSGPCASIRPIGDTASGSSLADLPSCCSAGPKPRFELLQKSLERNPSYGGAQLFLMAALSLIGREAEAAETAASFRKQYPDYRTTTFEQLWLSRSGSSTYRAQIHPLFERIRALGVAN